MHIINHDSGDGTTETAVTDVEWGPTDRPDGRVREAVAPVERGTYVELWVRRGSPVCVRDAQEAARDRLRRLRGHGDIDALAVREWSGAGGGPRVRGVSHAATCHGKMAEFEAWADDHGYTLAPGFQVREVRPMVGGGVRRKFARPVYCLAVYEGETLEAVYPHSNGGEVHTVGDGLDRLAGDVAAVAKGGETA